MFETDAISTAAGDLKITFIGHGTLLLEFGNAVVHVDPWSKLADYSTLPRADLVLVTHEHGDHLDPSAIAAVRKQGTRVLLTASGAPQVPDSTVMRNGDVHTACGLKIEAVPAYNLLHTRPSGEPFHPRGEGNGYLINFSDTTVYIAGDTEDIPEMERLQNVTIAFLPMNLPYTMAPAMVAHAVKAFRPKILYPYHFGDTDTSELVRLLADERSIEVRLRRMA